MSGNKNKASNTVDTSPQNESVFINGRKVSDRTYDPATKSYNSNIYQDPAEAEAQRQAQQYSSQLMGIIPQKLNISPEQQEQYVQDLIQPQQASLKRTYQKTLGDAMGAANADGVANSVGFENYRANVLDRNLAEGMSDIEHQARVQALDLPRIQAAPYIDALNAMNGLEDSALSRQMQTLNPAFAGSNSASANAIARMQAEQNRLTTQKQNKSFWGSFFG